MTPINKLHKYYDSLLQNPAELDWVEELLFNEKTKEFAMSDYITRLQGYFNDLHTSELKEEFELSDKIFKTINQEEKNFLSLFKKSTWYSKVLLKDILAIKIRLNEMYHPKDIGSEGSRKQSTK